MNNRKGTALSSINFYSVLMDVLNNIVYIVMGTLAAGMAVSLLSFSNAQKTYSTSATFAVTSQANSNYAYSNLSAAQEMAKTFTNVLQSDAMRKTIQEDLGLDYLDAKMTASQISETNLLKISVTADTPQEAYSVIKSLMVNYEALTKYATTDMIMDVLQEPDVPRTVSRSSYAFWNQKKYMAAAFAGLSALFVLLSLRNDTIKSETDFKEKLDTKSLGIVYHVNRGFKGMFKKKGAPLLVTDSDCGFAFNETFRKIAANVMREMDEKGAHVLMVTSVAEHEGKSTTALNLAMTMARVAGKNDQKVVLVDGDLRRPSIGNMLGMTVEKNHSLPDLAKDMTKLNQFVQFDEKSGLFVIPSRAKGYKASTEIMSSRMVKDCIRQLTRTAKYVIIDTPPMGIMADAEAVAQYADVSMLVVKYDLVEAAQINDNIDVLTTSNAEFIGTVFNDLQALPGQAAVAASRYGAYGRYGKYGNYGMYAANKASSGKGEQA